MLLKVFLSNTNFVIRNNTDVDSPGILLVFSSRLRLLKHPDLWTEHLPCFRLPQSKESHCWTTQTMWSTLGARGCWDTLIEKDCSSSGAATEWMKISVSERHRGRKQSFSLQSLFSWVATAGVTNIPNVVSNFK